MNKFLCYNYIQTPSCFIKRKALSNICDDNILDIQKISDNEKNTSQNNDIPTLKRTLTFPRNYDVLLSNMK